MKMKLKYYLLGLGIGIFITTLVLSFSNKKEKLSDNEVMARARELGMVMKGEETRDSLEDVIEKSLIKSDSQSPQDEKLVDQDIEISETADDDILPYTDEDGITGEYNSSSQIEDLEDLITVEDNITEEEEILPVESANTENALTEEDRVTEEEDVVPVETVDIENAAIEEDRVTEVEDVTFLEQREIENNNDFDYITFTIERGMSSVQVSELLYRKGLIEDAADFNTFIIEKGKSKVIRIGTFTLPKDASYQEILDTIA